MFHIKLCVYRNLELYNLMIFFFMYKNWFRDMLMNHIEIISPRDDFVDNKDIHQYIG